MNIDLKNNSSVSVNDNHHCCCIKNIDCDKCYAVCGNTIRMIRRGKSLTTTSEVKVVTDCLDCIILHYPEALENYQKRYKQLESI